ncbi:rRNA-binding ribosome biosynthesis protein rpf2 [Gurleya vavrai]
MAEISQKTVCLFSSDKKSKQLLQNFSHILPKVLFASFSSDAFDNYTPLVSKMIKNNCSLFIANSNSILTFGRIFNNEIIDLVEFKIKSFIPMNDFEINSRFFTALVNTEIRIENLFLDFFAFKGKEIVIEDVKHVLIIEQEDKILNFVLESQKENLNFSLEIKRTFFCEDNVLRKSCERNKVKKIKNVGRNKMGDVIGKLHIDKQDLREIQLKKARRVKNIKKE